ncbi:MAG: FAD synthase [Candidatus Magasanikbacteria bacterium]|nr:FAD synthase [Candidatus Magasanikbacteria bacterium]
MKVLLFGTFDILHQGHENLFKQARKYGGELIVCLARDATVRKIKKRPPFFKEKIRFLNLKKTGWVERIFLGDRKDYYRSLRKIKPDIICVGYDQKFFVAGLKAELEKLGLNTKIVRLEPFKPNQLKSSKMRLSHNL